MRRRIRLPIVLPTVLPTSLLNDGWWLADTVVPPAPACAHAAAPAPAISSRIRNRKGFRP